MPRKGILWNYFSAFDKHAKKAKCNYCQKALSYKTTITNLKNHLKQKHIFIYEEVCSIEKNRNKNDTKIADSKASAVLYNNVKGNNVDVGYIISEPESSIQNLPKMESKVPSGQIPAYENKKIDKLLLNMIAIDYQPLSIVNDEGFKAFVHKLNPNYKLPDPKTLSTVLLSDEYEERLAKIKEVVNTECTSMCITVDCWTSHIMQPYMAVMGHFINESTLDFKSILLQCSQETALSSLHTGENIAQAIHTMIQEWNLVGKVNFVVTDNTSNKQSAANLLGFPYCACFIDSLNLVAQHALTVPELDNSLNQIKKTVAHFKRNPLAKAKLIKYQIKTQGIAEENALTLIMSVPNRWNSTFLMLQRFVHLQEAITATVPNLNVELPFLPHLDWQCLEQYCEILKPLYEATIILTGENHLIASKALVITQGLLDIYEQMMISSTYYKPAKTLINSINYGLKQEFSDLSNNLHITTSTFLDPRFKQFAFDEDTLIATKEYITEQVCGLIGEDTPNTNRDNTASLSLWNVIEKNLSQSQQPCSTYTKVTEEIERYMKQVVLNRESCPLEWWRGHKTVYPSLFLIFVKYFNIIVTTVPCEQAFSKSGHIINDRRTRLTSSKVSQLVFLHGNKDLNFLN